MFRTLILAAALALAACSNPYQPLSPDFGNAVRANISAQVVNPNPAMAGANDMDGQRAGKAIDRYHTNKVYVPRLPLEGGHIYDQTQQQ